MKTRLANNIGASRKAVSSQLCEDKSRLPLSKLELRRIIVPIDFSSCSRKAVQYAAAIAKDYGATVILIHVLQAAKGGVRSLEKQLRILAHEEVSDSVPTKSLVKVGQTLHEIVNAAKSEAADLLVISTHVRGYLPDFCLGSAAEEIVRYAPCPVLVVRNQQHDCLRCINPPRLSKSR